MDFWRGEAYSAFFEYLDRRGGFYYEVDVVPPLSAPQIRTKE
jgi:Glycolipid 2-alpha-mannosyltransferase